MKTYVQGTIEKLKTDDRYYFLIRSNFDGQLYELENAVATQECKVGDCVEGRVVVNDSRQENGEDIFIGKMDTHKKDSAYNCKLRKSPKRYVQFYRNFFKSSAFSNIGEAKTTKLVDTYGDKVFQEILKCGNDANATIFRKKCGLSKTDVSTLYGTLSKMLFHESNFVLEFMYMFPSVTYEKAYNHSKIYMEKQKVKSQSFAVKEPNSEFIDRICEHPYVFLEQMDFKIKEIDAMALDEIGVDPEDPERLEAIMYYVFDTKILKKNHWSYVAMHDTRTLDYWVKTLKESFRFPAAFSRQELICGLIQNKYRRLMTVWEYGMDRTRVDKERHIYLADTYHAWSRLRVILLEKLKYSFSSDWQKIQKTRTKKLQSEVAKIKQLHKQNPGVYPDYDLNDEQQNAISMIFTQPLSFLIGGPGCGKTYTLRWLLQLWRSKISDRILCLAPTGCASDRMKNMTGYSECGTIDRFICRNLAQDDADKIMCVMAKDKWKNDPNTLVVVDETSMLDLTKCAKLMDIVSNCTVIFVGDTAQLSPIDAGPFLVEAINSKLFPVTELVTVKRTNAQALLRECQNIRNHKLTLMDQLTQADRSSYDMLLYMSSKTGIDQMIEVDRNIADACVQDYNDCMARGLDMSEVLLISPVKDGCAGVTALNLRLQALFNPKTTIKPSSPQMCEDGSYFDIPGYQHRLFSYTTQRQERWMTDEEIANSKEVHYRGEQNSQPKREVTLFMGVGDRVMCTENNTDIELFRTEDSDPDGEVIETSRGISNGARGTVVRIVTLFQSFENIVMYMLVLCDDGRFIKVNNVDVKNWQLAYALTVHKVQGNEAPEVIFAMPRSILFAPTDFKNNKLVFTAISRAKDHVKINYDEDAWRSCIYGYEVIKNCVFGRCLLDDFATVFQGVKAGDY